MKCMKKYWILVFNKFKVRLLLLHLCIVAFMYFMHQKLRGEELFFNISVHKINTSCDTGKR